MNKDQSSTRVFSPMAGIGDSRSYDGLRLSSEEVAVLIAQGVPSRFAVKDVPEVPNPLSSGDCSPL